TQQTVQSAEAPPAAPEGKTSRRGQLLRKPGHFLDQVPAHQVEHPGNGGENGDAILMDRPDQPSRLKARLIVHLGGNQRRYPKPHKLTEDMTERQRMQKAQRMKDALVSHVLADLLFQGVERSQYVPVRVNNALWLSR